MPAVPKHTRALAVSSYSESSTGVGSLSAGFPEWFILTGLLDQNSIVAATAKTFLMVYGCQRQLRGSVSCLLWLYFQSF